MQISGIIRMIKWECLQYSSIERISVDERKKKIKTLLHQNKKNDDTLSLRKTRLNLGTHVTIHNMIFFNQSIHRIYEHSKLSKDPTDIATQKIIWVILSNMNFRLLKSMKVFIYHKSNYVHLHKFHFKSIY